MVPGAGAVTLTRTGFIPIPPGREPGFDHADIYRDGAGAGRLYVAHTGADRVDVLDCAARTWLRALPDHPGVAGILIDPEADLLFTSDRSSAQVSVYRCSDETVLARVAVGPRPNGMAFDRRRRLFSFNLGEPAGENCTSSVIDLERQQVIATIPLPGRPRWAAYDRMTDQVYVNIRHPAGILAINAASLAIDRVIAVPAEGPHGLWIDGDWLYCAADGKALVVLHRDTGKVQASLSLPGAPDVVMHDPVLGHLYVAIGDPGVIAVADTTSLQVIENVPTELGAHTLGIDPRRHTVYVFLPASGGAGVYEDR
jgi:DNA-binding beta-propeller fold protein YncE